ncbi:MAG: hypothetical protein H0W78_06770 [Planctomycetes bacterium]|jgi:hypothetical protein|nr:hypothetical protein [Planctomycetota bacterium]
MRTFFLALLMCTAASVSAAVPLETVQWTPDSAKPTEAGMARRVQVYFLVDYTEQVGRDKYWGLRDMARDPKIASKFEYLHFLVAVGGAIEQPKEGDPVENWCKGVSNNSGLVRAFGGDATAVIVLVDGNGRITNISRLGDPNKEKKDIEALASTAKPLVADPSQFPLSCKVPLADLRVGDINRSMKNLKKAGNDAPVFVKLLTDRVNEMVELDVALLNDPATMAADKMIALNRLNGILAEFPKVPAASAAVLAIKKTKDDKQLANEQTAYAMLTSYIEAMKKVSAKKAKDVQLQWIPGITAKFGGTYAAEVATMIRKASRLDQTDE